MAEGSGGVKARLAKLHAAGGIPMPMPGMMPPPTKKPAVVDDSPADDDATAAEEKPDLALSRPTIRAKRRPKKVGRFLGDRSATNQGGDVVTESEEARQREHVDVVTESEPDDVAADMHEAVVRIDDPPSEQTTGEQKQTTDDDGGQTTTDVEDDGEQKQTTDVEDDTYLDQVVPMEAPADEGTCCSCGGSASLGSLLGLG